MRIKHAVSLALSALLLHASTWAEESSGFEVPPSAPIETSLGLSADMPSAVPVDMPPMASAEMSAAASHGMPPAVFHGVPWMVSSEMAGQGVHPRLQFSSRIATNLNSDIANPIGVAAIKPTADLWERIRIGFSLDELDTPLVRENENWYAERPDYMARMVERSRRYLFYIVEEVEKRGMPMEIALLPMIESAFNPKAYSRANASGIWQFMPSTGKNFGLQQNFWYDGRRDIVAATDAALDYLQKLHGLFGSWEIALAAYNWGEGNMQRAIDRNEAKGLPTDFLSLRMPPETRSYLPKLLAVKHIIADSQAFGLELESIPNQPYFARVATGKRIDMVLAARLAETSAAEFASLNPGHKRPVINGDDADFLLLPADKADIFADNLENYGKPLVTWRSYKLGQGEKLDAVARKFSISVMRLKEVNSIGEHRKLAGGTLIVPVEKNSPLGVADIDTPIVNYVSHETHAGDGEKISHTVGKGDTLLSIALRYGISVKQIKSLNHIKSKRLAPGQKLALNKPRTGNAVALKPVDATVKTAQSKPIKATVKTAQSKPVKETVKTAQSKPVKETVKTAQSKPVKETVKTAQSKPVKETIKTAQSKPVKATVKTAQSKSVNVANTAIKLSAAKEKKPASPVGKRVAGKPVETRQTGKPAKPSRIAAKSPLTHYTVRQGDTLSSIAKRFNVAANDIQRSNNLSGKRPLSPGSKVIIPGSS